MKLIMDATKLFDKLCKQETLWQAWNDVKRKNTTGGVDNMSVAQFEKIASEEIANMIPELKNGQYLPLPYKSISIPKDKKSFRDLGLLSIRDKIIQQGIYLIVNPFIDKQLSPHCYAYRKGKGAVKAVKRVVHAIKNKPTQFIVSCDIKAYFDNIDHAELFNELKKIIQDQNLLNLIELCIKMGKVKKGNQWVEVKKGVPQGGIISPLLSNFYLIPLDKAMTKLSNDYIRYADDFIILCSNQETASKATETIKEVCDKLHLELKAAPQINELNNSFQFLGIRFSRDGIGLDDQKKARMIEKLEKVFTNKPSKIPQILQKQINGYKAFYSQLLKETELAFIDEKLLDLITKFAKKNNFTKQKDLYAYFGNNVFVTKEFNQKLPQYFDTIISQNKTEPAYTPESNVKLISKRKREYRKLESYGKELIINTFGTYLGIKDGKIIVKSKESKTNTLAFTNLSHISILSKGVSMSTDFIYQCSEHKVGISLFSFRGDHYATIHSPDSTDSDLWEKQIAAIRSGKGKQIASIIVEAKIRNQANLLKYFHKYHKNADEEFANQYAEKIKRFAELSKKCKKPMNDVDYRETLISIEATAAMVYWTLVGELIDDVSDFKGRERKGAKDLVNCLLNYGYAILYARVWEALLMARLNPYISYLHVANTSNPTLAFDFIELFRQQAVDRVVISMLQKKEKLTIENGILDEESRAKLTSNIYERIHRHELFRGESRRFSDIIKIQARALARFIKDEEDNFKPYISKW